MCALEKQNKKLSDDFSTSSVMRLLSDACDSTDQINTEICKQVDVTITRLIVQNYQRLTDRMTRDLNQWPFCCEAKLFTIIFYVYPSIYF